MKKTFVFFVIMMTSLCFALAGCKDSKKETAQEKKDREWWEDATKTTPTDTSGLRKPLR